MKRRVIWVVCGFASVAILFVVFFSVVARDSAETNVERFIIQNGFVAGAPGGLDSQLSQIRFHSIYFYSIVDPSEGQVKAAFDSLTTFVKGWNARDEDETGAVFVNSDEESMIYSVELRLLPVTEEFRRKAGSALVLAVGRREPSFAVKWRRFKQSVGL